ncbi:MAG: CAP domain-containing protein, partial [Anaerolineae bacterium]|nr:CAP domain-containing protein [Anaerolineae bacterium]
MSRTKTIEEGRAGLPRRFGLVMSLCFIVSLFAIGSASAQDVAGDLLGRINGLRSARGLPSYSLNGALTAAASSQAQWMVANNCAIAHTHPDGSNPRSRAQAFGYTTSDVSENIYCGGNATTAAAWNFWVNSSIHYAGLVNTRYKEVGIAAAQGAPGTSFVL